MTLAKIAKARALEAAGEPLWVIALAMKVDQQYAHNLLTSRQWLLNARRKLIRQRVRYMGVGADAEVKVNIDTEWENI